MSGPVKGEVRPLRGLGFPYVDAPEFLDGIESDDLFEEIVPIVILHYGEYFTTIAGKFHNRTFPLGGLVNHSVHSFISGCLTLKLSLS